MTLAVRNTAAVTAGLGSRVARLDLADLDDAQDAYTVPDDAELAEHPWDVSAAAIGRVTLPGSDAGRW
ncbi:hypothetical protein [Amycolatopsis sp. NPDC051102]|uniref:hypothetical protein n=1 Tax=Amycolatopsis sp. NPDC051102 TaxID=3155163 RepID=UPI00342ED8FD